MAEELNESIRQQARRRFLEEYEGGMVLVPVKIVNGHIRELYRRHFDLISRQYFFAWFYGNLRGQSQHYGRVSKDMTQNIRSITEELKRRQTLAGHLLAEHGVKAVASKRLSLEAEARVVTPHSRLFLEVLEESDALLTAVMSLWRAVIIDDQQYQITHQEIIATVRNLHSSARDVANGIRDRVVQRNQRDAERKTTPVETAAQPEEDAPAMATTSSTDTPDLETVEDPVGEMEMEKAAA